MIRQLCYVTKYTANKGNNQIQTRTASTDADVSCGIKERDGLIVFEWQIIILVILVVVFLAVL